MKPGKFTVILSSIFLFNSAFAQMQNWVQTPSETKVFIENKGQFKIATSDNFKSDVKYALDSENEDFYFTPSGVVLEYWTKEKRVKSEEEKLARKKKKAAGFASREEFQAFEREGQKPLIKRDVIECKWIGANTDVEIVAENKNEFYHNYSYVGENGENKFAGNLSSYKKIIYKNLYPFIDVVYEIHPESGLKYSIIVHPGGDVSKVKLQYSKNIVLQADGSIHTATKFGDVIDHAPVTFYENDKNSIITSSYLVENNVIGFKVGKYNLTETLVIDPWTQSPTFATNWDCVWECEHDGLGNAYLLGGIMPMQIIKYNSAGTFQWTYNTPYDTSNVWLGTFAVDNVGNSYVTAGSSAQIQKVSTAGTLVWDNPSPGGLLALTEFWTITFNCDQTKLVIGGTDGPAFGGPLPYIFDIDMNSGNVTNSVQVTNGGSFQIPPNDQEVRAITPCNNAKYYFLTHDSIGYVHQNLNSCVGTGLPFHVNNGIDLGYKCENFRVDNSGIMALEHYNGFVFVHRGNQLQKRDFATATVVGTVAIPGGSFTSGFGGSQVGCSGIAIDDCGNIFVGSTNGVYKFDQNLTAAGSFPTAFNVYDVEVSTGGDILAAGSTGNSGSGSRTGSMQSFAASACAPQAIVCCDATVCTVPPVCSNAAPFSLTTTTAGGTWSSSCGSCLSALGVFDPAVSGQGTFTVTYTLACGSETQTITVNNCSALSVCIESNGQFTVSGGTGPYTWSEWSTGGSTPITNQTECQACGYTWFGFPVNQCFDGATPVTSCTTAAGYVQFATGTTVTPTANFPIQVEDNTGQIFTINSAGQLQPCTGCPTLTVTPTAVVATCNGQSTGSFSASTSGGASPYDYTLMLGASTIATFNNVAGSQSFTGLAAGSYTLNVVDNNGCPGTVNVTITSNPAITITQMANTPATCGSNNGSATVNATGGSGSFTYSWSPSGGSAATASGLAAGPYVVTATDGLGCTQTFNVTITSAGGPTVTMSGQTNPTCNNGTNGSATANPTGGTGTYTYAWSPAGGTGQTGTGLSGGVTYTVTVTDGNGCVGTATVTLTNPTAITVTTSATDATCGNSDGSLTAVGSGGTGSLTYSWNTTPLQTTANATSVPAGSYTVTVTDANGCTATANQTVNNSGAPTISLVSQVDATCNGDTDGSAIVTASGGTGGLTYSWNTTPVQTGTSATNLAAGTYIVTVTDGAGCSASLNVTILEPNIVTGTTTVTAANCGAADGGASVIASGGNGVYTYLWDNPSASTTSSITSVAAGTYMVTITDGNGCTGTATAVVGTVSTASISAGPDVIIVSGGSTTLFATGGVSYVWSPATGLSCTNCASPDANPTVTTMYIVTGTDANGCVGTDTVIVEVDAPCGNLWVPTAFSPNNDGNNEELCVYGGCITNMTFQLFDRWGNMVFETTDNSICWDGVYNGKKMNSAVFVYYLVATLNTGELVELKGNISLVR